jgi:hypothetical protein
LLRSLCAASRLRAPDSLTIGRIDRNGGQRRLRMDFIQRTDGQREIARSTAKRHARDLSYRHAHYFNPHHCRSLSAGPEAFLHQQFRVRRERVVGIARNSIFGDLLLPYDSSF